MALKDTENAVKIFVLVFGRTCFPWKVYPHHFVFCLLKYLCMCMCLIIQCIYKFTLYITYWIILYWPKLNSFFLHIKHRSH